MTAEIAAWYLALALTAGLLAKHGFASFPLPFFAAFWGFDLVRGIALAVVDVWRIPGLYRELWGITLRTIMLTGIALTTVWAFWFFLPQAIRLMPEVKEWDHARVEALVSNVTIVSLLWNIAGNFFATYLARAVGYRAAFTFLFAAGLACFMVGFAHPLTLRWVYIAPAATSFFILGVFGIFPMYVPMLYPTLLRTLGAGVTYNTGRLISAAGTWGTGWLVSRAGGPEAALWWVSLLYVPGLIVTLTVPRPRYANEAEGVEPAAGPERALS